MRTKDFRQLPRMLRNDLTLPYTGQCPSLVLLLATMDILWSLKDPTRLFTLINSPYLCLFRDFNNSYCYRSIFILYSYILPQAFKVRWPITFEVRPIIDIWLYFQTVLIKNSLSLSFLFYLNTRLSWTLIFYIISTYISKYSGMANQCEYIIYVYVCI